MSEQWELDFKAKLKQAEALLKEAENILTANGIQTPVQQPSIQSHEKIRLPTGYIRKASEFRERYRLTNIISDVNVRSNIAYALQASDLINCFHNSYDITLSAGSIFCKMSTAHVCSIIEALLFVAVNSYHEQCCNTDGSVCNRVGKCDLYIKKPNNYSFANLVSLLNKLGVVPLSVRQQA